MDNMSNGQCGQIPIRENYFAGLFMIRQDLEEFIIPSRDSLLVHGCLKHDLTMYQKILYH